MLPRKTLILVPATILAVAACYWYVDRPVAYFVRDHGLNHASALRWVTCVPTYLEYLCQGLVVVLALRRTRGPLGHGATVLLAGSLSLIVAESLRSELGELFGRYWPATWIDHNPSLLGNDVYGFSFFHGTRRNDSFPSGHTARVCAVLSVLAVAWPRWCWLCAGGCLAVMVSLVGMNYHFVGDVVGGAALGYLVGQFAALFAGLQPEGPGLSRTPCPSASEMSRES